ncbi:MAG: hypothetical protein ACW97A_11630, partial [Candidatus Thorarchaeota archaeon]
VHYPSEVVSEDGCVTGVKVTIRRANVLHAGKKAQHYHERFGIEPLVNQEHIDFVREFGTNRKASLNYNEGEVKKLRISELNDLVESDNNRTSNLAKDLISIIESNPNRLLEDEVNQILRPLGIEMNMHPEHLVYYENSERLSVSFRARTKSVYDSIRWMLIAPPNHPEKMEKAVTLVINRPDATKKVIEQITEDGLEAHPVWKEHGL